MRVKEAGQAIIKPMRVEDDDEVWWTPRFEENEEEELIRCTSISTELAEEAAKSKDAHTFQEMVPEQYQEF